MSAVLPIEEDDRFEIYTASSGQKTFAVPFPFQAAEDIGVYYLSAGIWVKIAATAYAVSGAGEAAGGAVALVNGRTAGEKVLVIGEARLSRLTSIVQAGRFASKATDDELDRSRIVDQEHARELGRAVKMARTAASTLEIADDVAEGEVLVRAGNRLVGTALSAIVDVVEAAAVVIALGLKADLTYVNDQIALLATKSDNDSKLNINGSNVGNAAAQVALLNAIAAVSFGSAQALSATQRRQARANIRAQAEPDVLIVDQKTAGTAGGSSTSTTYVTRTLNTIVRDPDSLVALASNAFTPTIDMWCEFASPAVYANGHRSRIYCVTDSAVVARGTNEYCSTTTNGAVTTCSRGECKLEAGKQYRLEHWVASGFASTGFGTALNNGEVETYAWVRMRRMTG